MKTHPTLLRSLAAATLAAAALLAGCAGTPGAVAADPAMKGYVDYKAAWNRHDGQALAASFVPGGTYSSPATGGPITGPAIAGYTGSLFAAMPDFHVEVIKTDNLGQGRVVDQWVVKGTWTQPFPGGPLAGAKPSGQSFVLPGVSVMQFEGDKLRSYTQYWDQLAFLTQLGVIQPK